MPMKACSQSTDALPVTLNTPQNDVQGLHTRLLINWNNADIASIAMHITGKNLVTPTGIEPVFQP